jgi:hypothetical protein
MGLLIEERAADLVALGKFCDGFAMGQHRDGQLLALFGIQSMRRVEGRT